MKRDGTPLDDRDPFEPIEGRCNFRKNDGTGLCRQYAGARTKHTGCDGHAGFGPCSLHGGRNRNFHAQWLKHLEAANEAAVVALAERHAVPIEIDPKDGILDVIARMYGLVNLYEFNMNAVDAEALGWGTTQETRTKGQAMTPKGEVVDVDQTTTVRAALPNIWLKLYDESLVKFGRLCKDAAALGIEERRIRIAERDGQTMAKVFRAWAKAKNIDLTDPAEVAILRQAMMEANAIETRAVEGG